MINEFNDIEITSVESFIHNLKRLTSGISLYKEIIDKFLEKNDSNPYYSSWIFNEFINIIDLCDSNELFGGASEDNMLEILQQLYKKLEDIGVFHDNEKHNEFLNKMDSYSTPPNDGESKQYHGRNFLQFFYRGESSKNWDYKPSIMRDQYTYSKETYYYHEIQVRCPNEFENLSYLDKLVKMQHYGCPTRLLDITSNPLGALYFACEENENDGRISIFPIINGAMCYGDSDKALILSCLPHLTNFEQDQILKEIQTLKGYKYDGSNIKRYLEKLYLEICSEKPAFQRRIKFGDILSPLFIQPNRANPRITNQQGAFLLSGLSSDLTQAEQKIKSRIAKTRFIIPSNQKNSILRDLDSLAINKASIYPNKKKIADYLKSH